MGKKNFNGKDEQNNEKFVTMVDKNNPQNKFHSYS